MRWLLTQFGLYLGWITSAVTLRRAEMKTQASTVVNNLLCQGCNGRVAVHLPSGFRWKRAAVVCPKCNHHTHCAISEGVLLREDHNAPKFKPSGHEILVMDSMYTPPEEPTSEPSPKPKPNPPQRKTSCS